MSSFRFAFFLLLYILFISFAWKPNLDDLTKSPFTLRLRLKATSPSSYLFPLSFQLPIYF
ncbi:unnamed protein product [Brassica rapa subsp. trilocularis]